MSHPAEEERLLPGLFRLLVVICNVDINHHEGLSAGGHAGVHVLHEGIHDALLEGEDDVEVDRREQLPLLGCALGTLVPLQNLQHAVTGIEPRIFLDQLGLDDFVRRAELVHIGLVSRGACTIGQQRPKILALTHRYEQ